jgi:nitroreductase
MDVFDAIRDRRSIKPLSMKSDPVDRALLERLFECANWAPSHHHTEPWRFIVFTGESRRALADAVVETMIKDGDPPIPENDPKRTSSNAKFLKPTAVIAIVCNVSTLPKVMEHEEIAATAIAVQNMQLAARAMGLACFWTSGEKAFHPKMARFLGIEPPARCLGFLYVGWPAIPWPTAERKPIAEKVNWR